MFSERGNDGIARPAAQWFKRHNPTAPAQGGARKSRVAKVAGQVATLGEHVRQLAGQLHTGADKTRHIAVLTPRRGTFPRFVSYFCQSDPFTNRVTAEAVGIAYPAIAETRLGTFEVCIPPYPEQVAIVRFLDHADRRIRRYIRAKQKLITLLEEQKQAIIHQVITGQIDVRTGQPYPAFDVDWLGEVPKHWNVRRLKTICSMKSGEGITATSIEPTGQYPVYGGNGLRGYTSGYTHDGAYALIGRQGALCGNVHLGQGGQGPVSVETNHRLG